jgi:hypothetical protein
MGNIYGKQTPEAPGAPLLTTQTLDPNSLNDSGSTPPPPPTPPPNPLFQLNHPDPESETELDSESDSDLPDTPVNIQVSFKNKADYQSDYYWLFSSYDGQSWWFMKESSNDFVERLYYRHQHDMGTDMVLSIDSDNLNQVNTHNNEFKYDFQNMTQTNETTGTIRRIYRLDRMELEDLKKEYREYYQNRILIWSCECGDHYQAYNPKTQEQLDDALHTGNVVQINMGTGYQYGLDTTNMIQMNMYTYRERGIVRADPNGSVEIRGILGIKLNL